MAANTQRRRRSLRLSSALPLLLPLLLLIHSPTPTNSQQEDEGVPFFVANAITVGDIFEIESECYEPLYNSDADGNGKVDQTEYITFVNTITENYFAQVGDDFTQLPLALQANFINLACLCEANGGTDDCCTGDNAHLSTAGAGPDDDPTNEEALYLFVVCRDTYQTAEEVMTEPPTSAPTVKPTLTPTGSPVTEVPTEVPTGRPTEGPTGTPTEVPTATPTLPPATDAPTAQPVAETEAPTEAPVVAPTTEVPTAPTPPETSAAPTSSPVVVPPLPPTAVPVVPTPGPVDGPATSAPTAAPAATPTATPTTATRAPTGGDAITGDLPISFSFSMSNVDGYDAADIEAGTNGNTILDDVQGGLGLLIPEIVEETNAELQSGASGQSSGGGAGAAEGSDDGGDGGEKDVVRNLRRAASKVVRRRQQGVVGSSESEGDDRRRRRLDIEYRETDPPAIEDVADAPECPENIPDASTSDCQVTTSVATVYLTEEDPTVVTGKFRTNMDRAIQEGRLDTKIAEYNPNNEVNWTGPAPASVPVEGKSGLSSGAIAGIAIGGVALVGIVAFLLLKKDKGRDKEALEQLGDAPLDDNDVVGDLSAGGVDSAAYGDGTMQTSTAVSDPINSMRASSAKVLGGGGFDSLEAEIPVDGDAAKARGMAQAGDAAPSAAAAAGGGGGEAGGANAGAIAGGVAAGVAGAAFLGAAARQKRSSSKDDDGDGGSVSSAGSSGWSSSAGVSSLDENSLERTMDADGDDDGLGPAELAALGVAGGVGAAAAAAAAGSRREGDDSTIETDDEGRGVDQVPDLPDVSREDLDTAIEAGDWAAVGATAALLASASDSASQMSGTSSKRSRSSMGSKSSVSSLDAARAAELDQLVDAGDWEGVVLAAAKFEAQSESGASGSHSASGSGSRSGSAGELTGSYTDGPSTSRSVGTSSAYTQSTGISESPSKAAKRAEIRTEVEALVRRVVPDEIDNVDEMMTQFRGREEELVETLRTMQERSIAQRARAAVHKSAKREARRSVQTQKADAAAAGGGGGGAGAAAIGAAAAVGAGAAAAAAVATRQQQPTSSGDSQTDFSDPRFSAVQTASVSASQSRPDSNTTESSTQDSSALYPAGFSGSTKGAAAAAAGAASSGGSSRKRSTGSKGDKGSRTALERAIEAGDWEAVGEAAALMSDASTGEGSASFDARSISTSGTGLSSKGRSVGTSVDADRAAELDRMIDDGDWTGVVAAASRFSTADKDPKGGSSMGSVKKKQKGGYSSIEEEESGSGSGGSKSWRKKMFGGSKRSASSKGSGAEAMAEEGGAKGQALQEEQEALAQAEIWEAIAAQSKQEAGAEAQGASDAADWAISRSLTAMKKAEGASSAGAEDDTSV